MLPTKFIEIRPAGEWIQNIYGLARALSIQVVFGGDPEAALIQYTKNEEARRAISSTEAVLNNRFIRVYWHRELGANATGLQQQEQSSGSQVAGSVPNQGLQHSNMHKVGINSGDFENPLMTILYIFLKYPLIYPHSFYLQGIKQHNPAAYVLNKTVPKHHLSATAGATTNAKSDNLNPNTDTAAVCFKFILQTISGKVDII